LPKQGFSGALFPGSDLLLVHTMIRMHFRPLVFRLIRRAEPKGSEAYGNWKCIVAMSDAAADKSERHWDSNRRAEWQRSEAQDTTYALLCSWWEMLNQGWKREVKSASFKIQTDFGEDFRLFYVFTISPLSPPKSVFSLAQVHHM